MYSIFNTTFEISLRVLLTLEAAPSSWRTVDIIAASDFITVYAKDFGLAGENLHGDNSYKYSEFALRRKKVQVAVKSLVVRSLIDVKADNAGYEYALSALGSDYCAKLEGDYAEAYRTAAMQTVDYLKGKNEQDVLRMINDRSVRLIQRSIANG